MPEKEDSVKSGRRSILWWILLITCYSARAQVWFEPGVGYSEIRASLERRGPAGELIAPINAYNKKGLTGLMKYSAGGKPDIVKLFIDNGADLDLRSIPTPLSAQAHLAGNTALIYAILNGNISGVLECAQLLINAGANVNAVGAERRRPVHYLGAIQFSIVNNQRMRAANMLIDAYAFVNAQKDNGNTMLHLAVLQNDYIWVKTFKEKYNNLINWYVKNNDGLTAWEMAKKMNQVGDGSVGAAIQTPVPIVGEGHLGYLDTDAFGRNGLMYSVLRDDMPFAKKMLQDGTDVNRQANDGNTALHYAALSLNPIPFISLLLENRADPNSKNNKGNTPLMYVWHMDTGAQKTQAAQLLLENGADITVRNKQGRTVFDILNEKKETALADFIKNKAEQIAKKKK